MPLKLGFESPVAAKLIRSSVGAGLMSTNKRGKLDSSPESPEEQTTKRLRDATHNPPPKMNPDMAEKILARLEQQSKEMKQSEERLTTVIENAVGQLQTRMTAIEEENVMLRQKNEELEQRMRTLERGARGLNVIFTGFEFESPQEGYKKMKDFVKESTAGKVTVSGLRTFRTEKTKKIVAACTSHEDKRIIMGLKKKLKDESDPKKRIYIDDDLPKADQQIQATLRKMANDLRSNGKEVKVELGRIRINNEYFYYNQNLQKLEPQKFRKTPGTNVERPGISEKSEGSGGLPN